MSHDEFQLNKDLLKEIVEKKKELREIIQMTQDQINFTISSKPAPAYEVFNL